MIRKRFATSVLRLAGQLPSPLAAPETPRLRAWRRRFIRLLVLLALLTWLAPGIGSIAPVGTALAWLALACAALIQGAFWVRAKSAADAAWLEHLRDRSEAP